MNRLLKKTAAMLTVLLLLLSCLPVAAYALEDIDQEKAVQLTIHFLVDDETQSGKTIPVEDAQFDLYYVAKVNGDGSYTLDGDFADYPVQVNDLSADGWRTLTQTLLNYISADGLQPLDTGKTNEAGKLTFPNTVEKLNAGLYLVDAKEKAGTEYTYQAEPFMVCLPGVNAEQTQWEYHVSVRVKYSKEPNQQPSYDTIDRRVLKVWEGDEEEIRPEKVVIELKKNGVTHDTVTLNAANNWRHLWEDLPRYDEEDKPIEWSVVEQNVKDYKFSVTLEGITFKVTNTYDPDGDAGDTIRRVVQKTWDDKGYESKRPKSITVYLMKNGEKYESQTLSSSNGWKYTWDELPAQDDNGKEIKWTIEEADISGYVANYVNMGDNVLITNSVVKPTLPQTGVLWWPVPVLVAVGLLMLILGKILKGRAENA